MDHPFAMGQRCGQGDAQLRLRLRQHIEARNRQLNRVFLEAVDAGKAGRRQKIAVNAQMGVPAWPGPVCQLGVDALAVHHQRCQQPDMLAAKILHQLRRNAVRRLRCHSRAVVDAVLRAELDVEQPQKVPDLGGSTDSGFSAATREPLLDRHRRRNAVDRVHFRATCGLHDGTGVGVERLQIATLSFVEKNVEGQCRFTRAGDAGDDAELAARDVDAQALEVVFAGVDDLNVVISPLTPPALSRPRRGERGSLNSPIWPRI